MNPFRRSLGNPIVTRESIPDVPPRLVDPSSVFNPGAVRHDGRVHLMLRVQSRGRKTFLMMARSEDGVEFSVEPRLVELDGIDKVAEPIHHIYDPRITALDGVFYVTLALDLNAGCRVGLARSDDLERFEFLGIISEEDNRNAVLFPEKVGGRYLRLDRPNNVSRGELAAGGDAIVLAESDDLLDWRPVAPLAHGRPRRWDELIGAGPPPVKTHEGWLLVYHGIATHAGSSGIYQAGAMLLRLDDPTRVRARTRDNVLEPREPYEMIGQVPNVIFPTGLVADRLDDEGFATADSRLDLYYGAADSCVALACTTVERLTLACV